MTPANEHNTGIMQALVARIEGGGDAQDSPDDSLRLVDMELFARYIDQWIDRLPADGSTAPADLRRKAWDLLDLVRRSSFLRRIPSSEIDAWSARIQRLVERSDFTVGPMFRHRAERYGSKPLFELQQAEGRKSLNWRQVAMRVEAIARGLLALGPEGDDPGPVAILSENRLEMALVDLACLTSGIVNVMFPGNSTSDDVGYMLRHSSARTVFVSTVRQLEKVLPHLGSDCCVRHVVIMDHYSSRTETVRTLDDIIARSSMVDPASARRRSEEVRIGDLATIMYTSGTTGKPKGIQFSHLNLVFKRFARALALPEIGEGDVFLCFLPLFHTFGRYLEMLGSIFWGATYCFLTNPSTEALLEGMARYRPTVFISVPKKWIQLYEEIGQRIDLHEGSDESIGKAVREVTGGRLRWGLSAAGHLDSEIFRFFQSHGTELMSGFGMTEGTGGITMTPPGGYRDNSLGRALPGIELRFGEDGELLIRGPYVMKGYLDPPEGEVSIDGDGWFATGDLMQQDRDGFLHLVDRKKEIYKNIKGETISPQRIENLFRGIESVGMAFLVGDHREYNTVLIYPNPECATPDISSMAREDILAHFGSVVVSVNKFLAPFERIVDFAVIDRNLDQEKGELTAKGTPRRKVVEDNFQDTIRGMYRRTILHAGGVDVIFPNWLLQALGLTARDIRIVGGEITLPSRRNSLVVRREEDTNVRIGSSIYRLGRHGPVNLGSLLKSPTLWLGNADLVDFIDLDLEDRHVPGRIDPTIAWDRYFAPFVPSPYHREQLEQALHQTKTTLNDIHLATLLLSCTDTDTAVSAVRLLEKTAAEEDPAVAEPALTVLRRGAVSPAIAVRRRAFQVLALHEHDVRFLTTLRAFLERPGTLLDAESRQLLCERNLNEAKVSAILEETRRICLEETDASEDLTVFALLEFLASFGACHPAQYRRTRYLLTRIMSFASDEEIREYAREANRNLTEGFRRWLGPASMIAVDPETGQEYRWDDVVVFDDNVDQVDRSRLLATIKTTPMLREGVFLFSGGISISLSDIPPGGIWIRALGANHGKTVHRITVQTRFQGSYDLAVNLNRSMEPAQVDEEILWLTLCGGAGDMPLLVEEFGGYWKENDLWTEEFISGATLDRAMRRISRRGSGEERLSNIWPFFAWTALNAHVDFWNRTGRKWEIADPSMANVVVPTHDYHTGSRLVSISLRREHDGILNMMRWFRNKFIAQVEVEYPRLAGLVGNRIIFSSILEILGTGEGVALLRDAIENEETLSDDGFKAELSTFLDDVDNRGFLPSRLHFAIERYLRWEDLNVDPTPQARATTMQEIYDTYGLQRLAESVPETRARFFRETVFRNASGTLAAGLNRILERLRNGEAVADEIADAVADIRGGVNVELTHGEDFFLTRLSFPHLKPEDAASFVDTDVDEGAGSEMVVAMEDREGNLFRIRHALNPREIARLHRLFLDARLDVLFRQEHQYLVALNERDQVIAGIFYEIDHEELNAHLEKIVVARTFRRHGVAEGLMNEFFNRLRNTGIKTVTTGFFRPEYFYTFDFKIEKKYAGLVKKL